MGISDLDAGLYVVVEVLMGVPHRPFLAGGWSHVEIGTVCNIMLIVGVFFV